MMSGYVERPTPTGSCGVVLAVSRVERKRLAYARLPVPAGCAVVVTGTWARALASAERWGPSPKVVVVDLDTLLASRDQAESALKVLLPSGGVVAVGPNDLVPRWVRRLGVVVVGSDELPELVAGGIARGLTSTGPPAGRD